jgi:hypothetical protein
LLRKYLLRSAAFFAAAAASLALAPAAFAGTIAVSQPCYVSPGGSQGAEIGVTGSGFNPGEPVFALIPAPGGLLGFAEATVAPDGTFAATITGISPETTDPVVENRTVQVTGVQSEAVLAEAPFELTNLAVSTNPPTASPHKKVAYDFSGFAPGRPIFGHYVRHGRVVLTYEFGKASGACGVLQARAALFPGRGDARAKYKVQFDDRRTYSPHTGRRIDTSLSTS